MSTQQLLEIGAVAFGQLYALTNAGVGSLTIVRQMVTSYALTFCLRRLRLITDNR
jgi:hypothetical protein